jgi:hypothetical protein
MEASEHADGNAISPDPNFAPDWPDDVRLLAARIFEQFTPDEIRGVDRLGTLSFDEAPRQLEEVQQIVRDLGEQRWEEIPPHLREQIATYLVEILAVLEEMTVLSANSESPAEQRERMGNRLTELLAWMQNNLLPAASRARFREYAREADFRPADVPILEPGAVDLLREQTQVLGDRIGQLKAELDSSQEAVTEARKGAGSSASQELEKVYRDLASDYARSSNVWLGVLVGALVLGFLAALLTYHGVRPAREAKEPHDYAALGFGVFVIGLIAFGIRVCAQNLRINRHLAAVNRSKASAISTFQRLATSVSDEAVRSAVTLTLAQAIFTVEETGLTDASGDHVTLVERAVIPSLPTPKV